MGAAGEGRATFLAGPELALADQIRLTEFIRCGERQGDSGAAAEFGNKMAQGE